MPLPLTKENKHTLFFHCKENQGENARRGQVIGQIRNICHSTVRVLRNPSTL